MGPFRRFSRASMDLDISRSRGFKRDFQAKVKAKQALSDLVDKLNNNELEVEKAAMMGIAAESGQMSEAPRLLWSMKLCRRRSWRVSRWRSRPFPKPPLRCARLSSSSKVRRGVSGKS